MQWVLIILSAMSATVATYLAIALIPASLAKRRAIAELRKSVVGQRGASDERHSRGLLALTYDDGPGSKLTPRLLDLLAAHHAKATFFLVGFRAERFPADADAIVAAGHEIGNHTHRHGHAWRMSPWDAVTDMDQGFATMSRWMGHAGLFRPPFGKLTTWTMLAARRRRAPLCFWTCDGGDTWPKLPDPESIARQVADAGGGVVLLHSHDRGDDRQRFVLAVTERLLHAASQHGMRICTMSEVLNAHAFANDAVAGVAENLGRGPYDQHPVHGGA